jgi:hypothetical protein
MVPTNVPNALCLLSEGGDGEGFQCRRSRTWEVTLGDVCRKKDLLSHLRRHSDYALPLLVSIHCPRHTTRRVCLYHPVQLRTRIRNGESETVPASSLRFFVFGAKSFRDTLTLGGGSRKRIWRWWVRSLAGGGDTGISTGEGESGSEAGESRCCN